VGWEASDSPQDLTTRARRAAEDGVERLLVAGGDGSQHLAVQGLVGSETALAPLPLGSGDDLAASLGVPFGLDGAFDFLLTAPLGAIDVIRCSRATAEHDSAESRDESVRFAAGVASVGFDAAVSRTANRMRRVPRSLLYPAAALATLARYRMPQLDVRWEGGGWSGKGLFVAVANTPRYGGGMRVAPAARPDDGWLDVVVVEAVARVTVLRLFPRIYSGRHVTHRKVRVVRGRRVEVAADRPLLAQGDGELLGPPSNSWRFDVSPAALRVVAVLRRRT
jgi:diacylglycerol kinase (ATP)